MSNAACSGFQVHKKMAQPAGAMADELGVEDRIAPVIVERCGWRARHLPAGQGGAGFVLRAVAQQDGRDAAFSRRESQPPAGHQVQAFGGAMDFQQQRPDMRAGQNVRRGRQGLGGIAGPHQDQLPRIAAQFSQAVGRQGAIFQRLIIGPHPEKRFGARRQDRQGHGKAAGAPAFGQALHAARRVSARRPARHRPTASPSGIGARSGGRP